MNVALGEGAEDRDFIAQHTLGWEAFSERILEFPPERVADICGLPVESIVALGKRPAHRRRATPGARTTTEARLP